MKKQTRAERLAAKGITVAPRTGRGKAWKTMTEDLNKVKDGGTIRFKLADGADQAPKTTDEVQVEVKSIQADGARTYVLAFATANKLQADRIGNVWTFTK